MTQDTFQTPSPQDSALLRKILLRLTAPAKLMASAVAVLVIWVWYNLLNRLLAFGDGIDYAGNHLVGAEATALLQRYNPYFWWALVALITIMLAWLVSLAIRRIMTHARFKAVDEAAFQQLAQQLSAPALDVLLWAWQPQDDPLRVGDLQLAHDELGRGRARRLQQAALQLATLKNARNRRQDPA
ncbi:hypothetical protein ACMHYJ_05085 [Castellaniella hirudinis]|uniref:hypothetical protein n=1 Tax=Castellaniella hirudinis TaxID=1144617 RepID=UPI0039C0BBE4